MKEIYKELNELLGGSPVMELKKTGLEKKLLANLLVKFEEDNPPKDPTVSVTHESITDRRIKAVVAATEDFGKLEKACRLLMSCTPDLKIFAAGPDMSSLPDLCTGFLETDPENGLFASRYMKEEEGFLISPQAGAVLSAAISLAKKEAYKGFNILVYLSKDN